MKKKSGYKILAAVLMVCSFAMAVAGGFAFGAVYGSKTSTTQTKLADIPTVNTSLSAYSTYSVAGVAEKAADSVVEIVTESVKTGSFMGQYITEGAGSGVIVTVDGYIVTNNHVIDGASKITVTLRSGEQYDAKLIGTDQNTDLAVIKIDVGANELSPATFGNSDSLVVGELAVAIGNPLGQLGGTVTDGIISALDREIEIDGQVMTLLQTNATINPGNSGGGLFNSRAELVGIVNAKSSGSDVEGLGFAIPVSTVQPIVKDIMEYGYVRGRISTGMSYIDVNNSAAAWMYQVRYTGVYINDVQSGSNAESAGLKSGDLVISVDGTKVSSSDDIKNIVQNKKIGDKVTYVVLRNNAKVTAEFALSEYSPQ